MATDVNNRVRGLVLNEVDIGESDKLLTVLTSEYGRISVMAKGARSLRSQYSNSAQLMCYSEMMLYKKGNYYWLREALPIESFYSVRLELDAFALVQYFFDICREVCPEGHIDGAGDVLRIVLNTVYALMNSLRTQEQIKAAFEFRIAVISGYAPDLTCCADCGVISDEIMYLDSAGGIFRCAACMKRSNEKAENDGEKSRYSDAVVFTPEVKRILGYIALSDPKRFLLFRPTDEDLRLLSRLCEKYLCAQLERRFPTLDFWHEMRKRYAD